MMMFIRHEGGVVNIKRIPLLLCEEGSPFFLFIRVFCLCLFHYNVTVIVVFSFHVAYLMD